MLLSFFQGERRPAPAAMIGLATPMHPDLGGSYRSTLVGAWIFGLAGGALLVHAALGPLATREQLGSAILYGSSGAICLLGAGLHTRTAVWYRCCSAVFYDMVSAPMILRVINDGRGRALFLELHDWSDQARLSPRIRIQCQAPAWDARTVDGESAKVRIAPELDGPVVVETSLGVLWPAPLARRWNRVEGALR